MELLVILVTAGLIALATWFASQALEAIRVMDAAERKQIKTALLINMGGPCASMFIDDDKYRHRSL